MTYDGHGTESTVLAKGEKAEEKQIVEKNSMWKD